MLYDIYCLLSWQKLSAEHVKWTVKKIFTACKQNTYEQIVSTIIALRIVAKLEH